MSVLLNTSLGDIVIDLHTEACPIACKNFLKLCKIKYYNNCLFHSVEKDFIAQTGDPTGTGRGGDSIYKFLYGDQARFFQDEIVPSLKHDKIGVVAMASAGEDLNASQFYITLRADLDYLDEKHTVFGEVAEGLETLMRINEAYIDEKHRPFKNIRIRHTCILDDPFEDPPQLAELIPDRSPDFKPEEGIEVRLEDDWVPLDELLDPEEVEKNIRAREAHTRAVVLEMVGDIPDAEVQPPDNVLFVCKLNPVTQDEDLELIFSRFGKVISADIIRDHKTGDSLCYGFVEFEDTKACEAAYLKMNNVLIDDRRIHVDFSQSVSRLWNRYHRFGTKGEEEDKQESERMNERPRYEFKDTDGQRGGTGKRYDLIFEDEEENGEKRKRDRHRTDENDRAKDDRDYSKDGKDHRSKDDRDYSKDGKDHRSKDDRDYSKDGKDHRSKDDRDYSKDGKDHRSRDDRDYKPKDGRDHRFRDDRDYRSRDDRDHRSKENRRRESRDDRKHDSRRDDKRHRDHDGRMSHREEKKSRRD